MINSREDINSNISSSQKSEFYQELIKSAQLFGGNVLEDDIWEHIQQEKNLDGVISQSEIDLHNNASRYGYKCENVAGDGNCFYLAIAVQLNQVLLLGLNVYEIKKLANRLRKFVCEYIELHIDLYKDFIDDSYNFINQKNDSVWVEDLIITALCHALNVNLVILRSDNYGHNIKKLPDAICTLFLGYQIGLHYQSLSPLDTYADKNNQLLLQKILDDANFDKFNAPATVVTQEKLIIKMNDLLSDKIIDGKLIPKNKVIKENLINYLFDVLNDKNKKDCQENHDAINLLKLFITGNKQIAYCGLNEFIYAQKKKHAIGEFKLFHVLEDSFMLDSVVKGLNAIRNKLIIKIDLNNDNDISLKENDLKQLVEDSVNEWKEETNHIFKSKWIEKIKNDSKGVLFFDGNKYELLIENSGKIGVLHSGEEYGIKLSDNDYKWFSEQHNTPRNYNGFYSFNNKKNIAKILEKSILDEENRKVLAQDIMDRLKQFNKVAGILNKHDKHSAQRLVTDEWLDLYNEQIKYEEEKVGILTQKANLGKIDEHARVQCEFSDEASFSTENDGYELIQFSQESPKISQNKKLLQDIARVEELLKDVQGRMLSYCSSFKMAEKYIAEYTLNPYFNLGINAAGLCAKFQNKSLFIVKSVGKNKSHAIPYESIGLDDVNKNEPVYLRYQEDDFSFCEIKQGEKLNGTDEMANKTRGMKKYYLNEKWSYYLEIINQLFQEIEFSMNDLTEYMKLLEEKIKIAKGNLEEISGAYDQMKNDYINDENELQSLKNIEQEKTRCFNELTVEIHDCLNTNISCGEKADKNELYKNLMNFSILPDEVRDKNGDTLLHVAVRLLHEVSESRKKYMNDIIKFLLDNGASAFVENNRWFGPRIFILSEDIGNNERAFYADSYLIQKDKERLYQLSYMDMSKTVYPLILEQNEFKKLFKRLKKKCSHLKALMLLNDIASKELIKEFWQLIISRNLKHVSSFPVKNIYEYYETPLLLAANLHGFEKHNSVYFQLLNRAHKQLYAKPNDFAITYKLLHDLSNEIIPDFKKVFVSYQLEQQERLVGIIQGLVRDFLRFLKWLVGADFDFSHQRAVQLALAYDIVFFGENKDNLNYFNMLIQLKDLLNNKEENIFNRSKLFKALKISTDKLDKTLVVKSNDFHKERDQYISSPLNQKLQEMTKTQQVSQEEQKLQKAKLQEVEAKMQQEREALEAKLQWEHEQRILESEAQAKLNQELKAILQQEREERIREREERIQECEAQEARLQREREENNKKFEQLFALLQNQQGQNLQKNEENVISSLTQTFFTNKRV